MAYPEEFEKLDQLLEKFAEEHPVTTRNQEVVTHVTGNGYSTPYYFLTPLGSVFAELYDKYTERSEEHTSELQSRGHLVCRLLLEKKKAEGCPHTVISVDTANRTATVC